MLFLLGFSSLFCNNRSIIYKDIYLIRSACINLYFKVQMWNLKETDCLIKTPVNHILMSLRFLIACGTSWWNSNELLVCQVSSVPLQRENLSRSISKLVCWVLFQLWNLERFSDVWREKFLLFFSTFSNGEDWNLCSRRFFSFTVFFPSWKIKNLIKQDEHQQLLRKSFKIKTNMKWKPTFLTWQKWLLFFPHHYLICKCTSVLVSDVFIWILCSGNSSHMTTQTLVGVGIIAFSVNLSPISFFINTSRLP